MNISITVTLCEILSADQSIRKNEDEEQKQRFPNKLITSKCLAVCCQKFIFFLSRKHIQINFSRRHNLFPSHFGKLYCKSVELIETALYALKKVEPDTTLPTRFIRQCRRTLKGGVWEPNQTTPRHGAVKTAPNIVEIDEHDYSRVHTTKFHREARNNREHQ